MEYAELQAVFSIVNSSSPARARVMRISLLVNLLTHSLGSAQLGTRTVLRI